jgi:hypothetical protein
MRTLFFLILIVLVGSCDKQRNASNHEVTNSTKPSSYYSNIDINKWNNEYWHIDSVLMGGKVPLITDTATLFQFLGKPEKILPISISRNNCWFLGKGKPVNANYLIYGNTIFEQMGKDVIVNTIDFESTPMELLSSKINIKIGLQPIDIQKAFPESGRLLGRSGNLWTGNIMVSAIEPHGGIHDVWFFIFIREKLRRVVLFSTSMYIEEL